MVFVNSCPYLGGAELWHLRTALAFQARGHEVTIMARNGPLADQARAASLPVITLAMSSDLDLVSYWRAYFFFKKNRPDLILLNDQREGRVIAPAAARAGVKVRVQRKGWPFLKGSWRDKLVYRYAVTHLIANSEAVARVFSARSGLRPERIVVFPNSVDLNLFQGGDRAGFRQRLGIPETDLVAGSAGRLVTQKGFDLFLEAAAMLRQERLNPWIVIAGTGPEETKLRSQAEERGIADRLLLPGQVNDMPAFLAALDLFVFTSHMEGRSNALAEAMAAGLPIVASDIPGNDEIILNERTGILYPPGDLDSLTGAMERLLKDRELAARYGRSARKFAEEHLAADRILAELEEYLLALVKGETPPAEDLGDDN